MADGETASPGWDEREVGAHWRWLVSDWATHSNFHSVPDATSISLEFDLPEVGRVMTVRFMATARLLVAFMTDGRFLSKDQLALGAAAANAWNVERLIPVLSVWDVRGPHPCLAGSCVLPLTCRIAASDFHVLAGEWVEAAVQMFTRCHQVFRL